MKLLFFSGSNREYSLNFALCNLLSTVLKEKHSNVICDVLDLKKYTIPMYNGDIESNAGIPKSINDISKLLDDYDGFCIASPEYNGFFSPFLKNIIDWLTRINKSILDGKICFLSSISPSSLGGQRGLLYLNILLNNLGCIVFPHKISIHSTFEHDDVTENILTSLHKKHIDDFIKFLSSNI